MDLTLQPKPEVEITSAEKGIISKSQYFVEKEFEKINQYCFPAHFIRNWKPKAQLLYPSVPDETLIQYECDFNRNIQSCFVEDYAEEVFLRTPPPCFVVIGKCGTSVNKLGQEIAKEYGSVLLQVDDIVNQVIQTDTETSSLLHRILRLGVSLTLNFILPLLSFLAHTPEARHRGYVLCGLPRIPEFYDLSVEQQFNYLFTWDNKPTVFINVLFDDEDLIRERTNLRCETKDTGNEKFILFHPLLDELSEDEEEPENPDEKDLLPIKEETIVSNIDIDISPSRPWVRLPRDEESHVWSELELFNMQLKPAIELITSRVDPQYFITVDSRVQNEFEMVRARLSLLQIWKSPVAFPFITPKTPKPENDGSDENNSIAGPEKEQYNDDYDDDDDDKEYEENDEDPEILRAAEEPPEVAFLTLFRKKTISPKFRWELSHYNYICPVSLREGVIVEGKSAYAAVFMKYIYFLCDEKCMEKFLQNPRAYVLPIRPKPLCRFIILGFPFTGKTTLAYNLAQEFSIPFLDLNVILKRDIDRKKDVYRNFCKQKAECREILRLTNLAWQDWRLEEERRVTLLEHWIFYIQSLLNQRITQFYSPESNEQEKQPPTPAESTENIEMQAEDDAVSADSEATKDKALEVHGVAIDLNSADMYARERTPVDNHSTASVKIIHAMKHEDFDFNEKGLEVEANLFFSSLWNTFSGNDHKHPEKVSLGGEDSEGYEGGEDGEGGEMQLDNESVAIDWFKLLPPQSLSTLLMNRKHYTIREKRRSFQVLLEAASKNYWTENSLKSEFEKWRLPCFMDIPLCEIFLDNPILLLKYVPEWLKERPPIPDPVDPGHPSVIEAGEKAFVRANVVKIRQNHEEVAILLRDAIEKAEREGMRVTGEVISPGGWVLDNMTLDIEVWKKLACENIFADHIYILIDPDPEFRRILHKWCDICCPSVESSEGDDHQEDTDELSQSADEIKEGAPGTYKNLFSSKLNLKEILRENVEWINQNEEDLDDIYSVLQGTEDVDVYSVKAQVDPFCHGVLYSMGEKFKTVKVESIHDEMTSSILFHSESASLFVSQQITNTFAKIHLGSKLQVFTERILQLFYLPSEVKKPKNNLAQIIKDQLEFFINLLTLQQKLDQIIEFLTSLNRENVITQIDISNKKEVALFNGIRKELLRPFIKKPRELEDFEIKEIQNWTDRKKPTAEEEEDYDNEKEEEEKGETNEEEEDIRIFGESGSLCVVNLERNILLPGKPEIALRYYGKLYYFWNEIAKNKFIEDPEKYAPYYSAIRCYPPLRIFVMGPIGSGKSKLCHAIADQCSLNYVDYLTLLNKNLLPNLQQPCEKFTALYEQPLLLREEHNASAKAAKEQFMSAPTFYRNQWLECPFYSDWDSYKDIIFSLKTTLSNVPSSFPELTYENIEAKEMEELLSEEYDLPPQPPFISMKEIESILNKYIQNVSDLDEYCIKQSLTKLWNNRPYITEGFVLEGFPMRAFDVKRILENNWMPDLVIELTLPEDVLIENNIENMMTLWDTKLKQETVEEKLLEDTLEIIQRSYMWTRRDKLMLDKLANAAMKYHDNEEDVGKEQSIEHFNKKLNKKTTPHQNGFVPAEVEMEIIAEIDEILKNEFPPLEFKTIFETYDAGKARLVEDLVKNYRRDVQEINIIKKMLQKTNVQWYEVNAEKDYETNLNAIFILLDKIRKRSNQKGEFAFTMKMEMAEKLLEQGYYFLSKFGRWCPVQVYRLKNSIHMFRPLSSRGKVVPIAYRNYIYFVAGENEQKKFIEDPIRYTFNEPHHPNIPVRVAVIGPPKSGKSTLCVRLGAMFGLKVVTMGTALRFVVENIPRSTLAQNINNYLKRGCFLPLSLKIEALMACLNDVACVTQGFVLDGIPFDAALTQSLAERGKLPFVIISLTADVYFGKTNRQNLNLSLFRLPYKNRVNLDMRYKDWDDSYKKFEQWNQLTYNNLYQVKATLSVVDIFYQAYDIIRKSLFGILYYVEYCVSDKVLPLQYLCVSQHEYEMRKSALENNCPVCWADLKKLSSNADPPERSGLVQYIENFYWVCPDHMEKFKRNPKIYFPPHAEEAPKLLPKIITKKMFAAMTPQPKIHGYGRCPVTRIDFPSKLDWEGSWDFAALYGDEVFLCKNKEMLDRFLATPWNYVLADTIFERSRSFKSKAVQELEPPIITSLPPIGFLEQTVAELITEALRILGSVRPIYPNMSMEVTGCIFLGLLLKSENSKNKYRHLIKQYLNFMVQNCKASAYRVEVKTTSAHIGQGDFEATYAESIESEVSETEGGGVSLSQISLDSYVVDVDSQGDKQMWSAQNFASKLTEMKLTAEDELEEIPFHPQIHVILKYQSYVLRHCPLPPIDKCVSFIYSARPNMEIPEPFNYNSLYQPPPLFSSPYTNDIVFNPEKEFSLSLYNEKVPGFGSKENVRKGPRAYSLKSDPDFKKVEDPDYDIKLVTERFMPRFQLLDKIPPLPPPSIPKVVEADPIIYNPQRDQTYMMLYAEFFHVSHVLRCYQWSLMDHFLELDSRLSRNLGLATFETELLHRPKKQPSVEMKRSIDFYHDIFDTCVKFVSAPEEECPDDGQRRESTLINFIHMIILEKIDEIFAHLSEVELSYDSFEAAVVESESKVGKSASVLIKEIFPYPPLPWDIVCRPYFAYASINSIFNIPRLDNIAHERHFSLLDGIELLEEKIRFIRYPSWLQFKNEVDNVHPSGQIKCEMPRHHRDHVKEKPIYFSFDFFNLPWTSFMPYPFAWAYNEDVSTFFRETLQTEND